MIESLSGFVPLFVALVWAALALILLLPFRGDLKLLVRRVSGAGEFRMSVGALKVEAKAMRELQRSIGVGLPEEKIDRETLNALLDTKLRAIQAAIEHKVAEESTRVYPRIPVAEEIWITTEDGQEFEGTTIDVSEAGIGFKSPGRLRFFEMVKISPRDGSTTSEEKELTPYRIVRIEHAQGGFYYGAQLPRQR